ncbi:MAG: RidA family protein [Ignavibacteriales bacterium]|nr:RidA family protein [Ignavibacteriales bacterium]
MIEERLREMGYAVPEAPAPLAAYVPATRSGSLAFTAGQLPIRDGELIATGKVGADVGEEKAVEAARVAVLNALGALKALLGDLEKIRRVVKVNAYVASAPDYYNHPAVANGASELIGEAFGEQGAHARAAVGVAALPKNAPVEIELVVEVGD